MTDVVAACVVCTADVTLVYLTVATMVAAHLMVVTVDALYYGRRKSQWRLGMLAGTVLGLSLGAQFGLCRWLTHLGWLVGYPSEAMVGGKARHLPCTIPSSSPAFRDCSFGSETQSGGCR